MSPSSPSSRCRPEFARGARGRAGISLGVGAWGLMTGGAIAAGVSRRPLATILAGTAVFLALRLLSGW